VPFAVGEIVAVTHVNAGDYGDGVDESLEFCKVLAFDGEDYILRDLDRDVDDMETGQWLCMATSQFYRLSRAICTFVGPVKCP
jgi:hypothetical protein